VSGSRCYRAGLAAAEDDVPTAQGTASFTVTATDATKATTSVTTKVDKLEDLILEKRGRLGVAVTVIAARLGKCADKSFRQQIELLAPMFIREVD
jgi:hypothetical protein